MLSPPPPPPPVVEEDNNNEAPSSMLPQAAAQENNHTDASSARVLSSRSIMVGSASSPLPPPALPVSRENSSVGLDMSLRSVASTLRGNGSLHNINFDDTNNTVPSYNVEGNNDYDRRASSNYNIVQDLVQISVADACINAYGCVFIEVWRMNPNGTALKRVEPSGHYMDPAFANSLPSEQIKAQALELDRYARDCPPGVGVAGTLFNSADFATSKRKVYWRQIREMLNDPFVQRGAGQRMKRLHHVGIGLVGFVPFIFQDENGLVCFFSRYNADFSQLRSSANEGFLIGSTDMIGSQIAIQSHREACAAMRREMVVSAVKKVRKEFRKSNASKSLSVLASSDTFLELLAREREEREAQSPLIEQERTSERLEKRLKKFGKKLLKRINNSRKKWKGTELEGPPCQSFGESAFVVFGVFFTMLSVLRLANAIGGADEDFMFDGGWYASSLCIIFALTPAPVGQPRQIFAAHLWNMIVGLALRQIPSGMDTEDFIGWNSDSYGLPLIWKQALAVAFGVAGQAKIGILHPPATSLSYAFVTTKSYSWGTISSVYLADVVVVVLALLILNLSESKQYPIYWLGIDISRKKSEPFQVVVPTIPPSRQVSVERSDDKV